MQEDWKTKLKNTFSLTDERLVKLGKYAKWAKGYSKSAIIFWGVAAGALLGAHAFGFALPAVIGGLGIGTAVVMGLKSVALIWVFDKLHKKGLQAAETIAKSKGLTIPEPEPQKPKLSKLASLTKSFKLRTAVERIKSHLPRPGGPKVVTP